MFGNIAFRGVVDGQCVGEYKRVKIASSTNGKIELSRKECGRHFVDPGFHSARSEMFIALSATRQNKLRSKERNSSRAPPLAYHSAPSNGAGGSNSSIYKHVTPNGVKPVNSFRTNDIAIRRNKTVLNRLSAGETTGRYPFSGSVMSGLCRLFSRVLRFRLSGCVRPP